MKNFALYCLDMLPALGWLFLSAVMMSSALLIFHFAPVLSLVDKAMILIHAGGSLLLSCVALSRAYKASYRYWTACGYIRSIQPPEEEDIVFVLRPLDI